MLSVNKINELRAENERLRKEIDTWKYQTEKRDEIGDAWYDIAQKYKACIQEIKELAENFCNACKEFEPDKYKVGNCEWCNYNRVLQLIDKVEV